VVCWFLVRLAIGLYDGSKSTPRSLVGSSDLRLLVIYVDVSVADREVGIILITVPESYREGTNSSHSTF
jgi:hypothetical protein